MVTAAAGGRCRRSAQGCRDEEKPTNVSGFEVGATIGCRGRLRRPETHTVWGWMGFGGVVEGLSERFAWLTTEAGLRQFACGEVPSRLGCFRMTRDASECQLGVIPCPT